MVCSIYIYNEILHSHLKKNVILPLAATWMDLEDIMVSEMSDRERYSMIPLTCGI